MMMQALWRRRALSALLAAGVATAGLPGVGRAADGPDLTIEPGDVHLFKNPAGQVNDRVVSFTVKNVGTRDVPIAEATGTLEITSPLPASAVLLQNDKLIAKNGGSFQGVAQLPAPCDGTEVTVSLFAKGETNRANNTLGPLKLCPDKPQPVPEPSGEPGLETISRGIDIAEELTEPGLETISRGIDIADELTEHLQPGEHTLDFAPSALRSLSRTDNENGIAERARDSRDPDDMWVGWGRSNVADFIVSQTAVNFDLAKLLEAERPHIAEAHLSFIEHEQSWIAGEDTRADVPGCVSQLDVATNDWRVPREQFIAPDLLFRSRYLTDVFIPHTTTKGEAGSIKRWRAFDVTGHVLSQMYNRDDPKLWLGYVLRGALEKDDGVYRECMSRISNMHLWVTYVVGSN